MSHSRWSPQEAAAARERAMSTDLVPYVLGLFEEHSALRSCALCVAQFWCDEALDAVHYRFVWSERETPEIEAGLAAGDEERDDANLPTLHSVTAPYLRAWDDNGDAISLYASYCRESCDQEMSEAEVFLPYAIFRRTAQGVAVQRAPTQRRPWLDGVRPVLDDESGDDGMDLFEEIYEAEPPQARDDGARWWESERNG
jgi:hypothetical protein